MCFLIANSFAVDVTTDPEDTDSQRSRKILLVETQRDSMTSLVDDSPRVQAGKRTVFPIPVPAEEKKTNK